MAGVGSKFSMLIESLRLMLTSLLWLCASEASAAFNFMKHWSVTYAEHMHEMRDRRKGWNSDEGIKEIMFIICSYLGQS